MDRFDVRARTRQPTAATFRQNGSRIPIPNVVLRGQAAARSPGAGAVQPALLCQYRSAGWRETSRLPPVSVAAIRRVRMQPERDDIARGRRVQKWRRTYRIARDMPTSRDIWDRSRPTFPASSRQAENYGLPSDRRRAESIRTPAGL